MNNRSPLLLSLTCEFTHNGNELNSLSDLISLYNTAFSNDNAFDQPSWSHLSLRASGFDSALQNLDFDTLQSFPQLDPASRREILDRMESMIRIRRFTQNSLSLIISNLIRDYIQRTLLSRLLSDAAKQNEGLSKNQIEKIALDEYKDKAQSIPTVARIKSRNGIHKKSKESLKKIMKNTLLQEETEPTSNSTCAICLEDYKDKEKLRKLPCKHKFHKDCADNWLCYKNACPVCKGKAIEESLPKDQTIFSLVENVMNNSIIENSSAGYLSGSQSNELIIIDEDSSDGDHLRNNNEAL